MRTSDLTHHECTEWYYYTNFRMKKAIDAWRPDRPRWWLSHYGEILYGGDIDIDVHLKERFLRLRAEAVRKIKVGKIKGAGVISYKLHLHDI